MKLGLMFHNNHNFELARKAYDEAFDLQNKGVNSRQPSLERLPEAPHAYRDHKVEPSSLDPVLAASSDTESFVQLLFSGLVFRTPGGEIIPDIAWRWDMLDGGTHYIFHLRDDVFWTDGRPVTAADFEFAWKRLLHPRYGQSPALLFYDIVGARAFNQGESSNEETIGVFAENSLTLHVRLIEPVSHFIQILSQGSTFPVPRHQVLENPEWANPDHIVCNGAFQIKGWITGQESILERNANYHRPYQGNVKEIYTSFRDPSLMPELYAAGDLDVLTINLLDHESQLKVMRRFASDYSSVPSPFLDYYWVDVNRSPMDNKFVRLALARAVDRRQLVDTATRGLYYPATGGLVPPGIPGHVSGIATPADPDEARRLLAQAGYPSGKDLPPLEIITSFIPNLKAMTAELARQWWTVLGIQVEVINMPSGQFRQRWLEAPPHAWMLGWTADYPDPYSFLNDASWRPIGGWRHETYDQLIAAAWSCPDNQKRLSLYALAEQILLEEAPAVPLAYPRIHLLIKPWIKNWQLVGTYDPFFPNVVIEAH